MTGVRTSIAAPWRDLVRSTAGRVALALLVLHAVVRALLASRAYFTQDDYLMIALVVDRPLSLDLLLQGYSGHVFPGGFAIAWLQTLAAPLSWPAAAAVIATLSVLVSLLGWLVVSWLVPSPWRRLLPMVVLLANPLTLWSIQWWAVAIQFLPVTTFLLATVAARLRWQDRHGRLAGALVPVGFLAALAFQERGLLVAPAALLLCVAVADGRPLARVRGVLRDGWWQWLAIAVLGVAYLFGHSRLAPIDGSNGPLSERLQLVSNAVLRIAVPGLWGGPGPAHVVGRTLIDPHPVVVVAAGVATLLLLAWSIRRFGTAARWAWLLLAVIALLNVGLLFGGRADLGPVFGLTPRYSADLVPVLVLALCVVTRSERLRAPDRGAGPGRAFAAVVVGYLALCTWTTAALAATTFNPLDREWVTNARADLRAHPGIVLYDVMVPEAIMTFWFEDEARASTVLAAAPENPVFDVPTPRLWMPDPVGHLREVALVGGARSVPADDRACGYHVTSTPVRIPLEGAVEDREQVLRIGYYASAAGTATVTVAGRDHSFDVAPGLNAVDLVVDGGGVDSVTMRLAAPEATVCVPTLELAFPTPLGG